MPTVSENRTLWALDSEWAERGDNWSDSWGGPKAQWLACLHPRLSAFLPTGTILEIAPGYGRWTQFLKDYCEELVVVDLEKGCIDHCRKRFQNTTHITYHVNDGSSLAMVEDSSVDLVFSFDSLVHVEADCLEAYLRQLRNKLSPHGIGFIHHSNLAEFGSTFDLYQKIPGRARRALQRRKIIDDSHWRARSVSAGIFRDLCQAAGLVCVGQELINWGSRRTIDCLSLFTLPGSPWERPNQVIRNPEFMREAGAIRRLAGQYMPNRG
jgi:SAM-dependent methyltransferase